MKTPAKYPYCHNEKALLGAVLGYGDCWWDVCELIGAEDFASEAHRAVWAAFESVARRDPNLVPGIDMAKLGDFVAFRAAIELLHDRNMEHVIDEVYEKSLAQVGQPKEKIVNYVKEVYEPFTQEEVSQKIAEMLTPKDINAEVEIIYQTVDNLHQACPKNLGDWYFTGDYPTPGGRKVVNQSFVNYVQGKNVRAY